MIVEVFCKSKTPESAYQPMHWSCTVMSLGVHVLCLRRLTGCFDQAHSFHAEDSTVTSELHCLLSSSALIREPEGLAMEIKHLVLICIFLQQMQATRLALFVNRKWKWSRSVVSGLLHCRQTLPSEPPGTWPFVNRRKQQIIQCIRVANATISLDQAMSY